MRILGSPGKAQLNIGARDGVVSTVSKCERNFIIYLDYIYA